MMTGRNLHELGLMNGTLLRLLDEIGGDRARPPRRRRRRWTTSPRTTRRCCWAPTTPSSGCPRGGRAAAARLRLLGPPRPGDRAAGGGDRRPPGRRGVLPAPRDALHRGHARPAGHGHRRHAARWSRGRCGPPDTGRRHGRLGERLARSVGGPAAVGSAGRQPAALVETVAPVARAAARTRACGPSASASRCRGRRARPGPRGVTRAAPGGVAGDPVQVGGLHRVREGVDRVSGPDPPAGQRDLLVDRRRRPGPGSRGRGDGAGDQRAGWRPTATGPRTTAKAEREHRERRRHRRQRAQRRAAAPAPARPERPGRTCSQTPLRSALIVGRPARRPRTTPTAPAARATAARRSAARRPASTRSSGELSDSGPHMPSPALGGEVGQHPVVVGDRAQPAPASGTARARRRRRRRPPAAARGGRARAAR